MPEKQRHCWLRLKRHDWQRTGGFRFGPGMFNRGPTLRCLRCGWMTATSNPNVLDRAHPYEDPTAEEAEANRP